MTKEYVNNVDNLIKVLTRIKEKCGGHTPLQINLYSDKMIPLSSICLDNDMGNEESIVYIEGDYETESSFKGTFTFYTQGKEI